MFRKTTKKTIVYNITITTKKAVKKRAFKKKKIITCHK